jgi:hypothetical protein
MPFTRLRQSLIKPNGSITGSLSGTSSYSRRALTASYALNASGGSISYITGSPVVGQYIVVSGSSTTQYALIQSVSNPEHLLVSVNGVVQNYSSSYTVTGSTLNFYQSYDDGDEIDVRFLNGGTTVQTGSIAKQTLWTNVTSGSTNTISGLSLSSNKWDVSVVEEWDAATLDQYYNSSSLLCHFDSVNAAGRFIDNSRNNFAITSSGDVSLSDSQYKFGGASAYFDGTGDYLVTPTTSVLTFGTNDLTVELWIYQTVSSVGAYKVIVGDNVYSSVGGWTLYSYNNQLNLWKGGTELIAPSGTLTLNSWNYVVWTRQSGNNRIFINGTQVGSTVSDSTNYTSTAIYVGSSKINTLNFAGYVDELRITKGVARYTANFTPRNSPFPNSRNQVLTRYVGLVGGIDDKYVDYGVQKLSNSSLKLTRLTYPNQPIVGSGSLSGSVSRVYVNVLDYDNVSISGSISNAVTASYALTSATSRVALSASYLIPTSNNTTKAIFGYGLTSVAVSVTNLVSNTGVVATDTTGVGSVRWALTATGYGTDKAIFGYGYNGSVAVSVTNLVSNTGVVATDTTGVGTARSSLAAAGYGTDKAIFGYGYTSVVVSMTNLVSNTGVVATDTTGVGSARTNLAAAGYGTDKAIFGYGYTSTSVSMTNLVSNTGVVATDTTGVGTVRYDLAAAGYGTDKAIFGYGFNGSTYYSITNLVSNTGTVATNTTGVGTARHALAAAGYGGDKAIFGYGSTGTLVSIVNLVSNTGVVANDTLGVGTARMYIAAAGYSTS